MNNNYDLLNGLFTATNKSCAPTALNELKNERPTTKRTFKILNEPWDDFLVLATLKGKTQADLINSLIEQAISDNATEIERYKEIVKR